MMEEVSVTMALDAHAIEQMSEEEIFACLDDHTAPRFTVPTKKAKLKERLLQIMEDAEEGGDCLDEQLKENQRLQRVNLRLEQENDNLAHRLISGKVELRRALDTVEERVYELARDVLQRRKELQVAEDEKALNEEETAMLKEVFRRELEKSEQRVRRSAGIVQDYKQICSQLTERLERQQAAHREEFDAVKSRIKSCSRCQRIVDSEAPAAAGQGSETAAPAEGRRASERGAEGSGAAPRRGDRRGRGQDEEAVKAQVKALERELAHAKLLMVEAECKIQELEHQKGTLANELQDAKNSWISKAFTSLRASGGGLPSPREEGGEAPVASQSWSRSRSLRGATATALSGWSSKKLPQPQRDGRKMSGAPMN